MNVLTALRDIRNPFVALLCRQHDPDWDTERFANSIGKARAFGAECVALWDAKHENGILVRSKLEQMLFQLDALVALSSRLRGSGKTVGESAPDVVQGRQMLNALESDYRQLYSLVRK